MLSEIKQYKNVCEIYMYVMMWLNCGFNILQAIEKGASTMIVGLIFGCFEFVFFISAPVFGVFVSYVLY